jgi:hypothetical protein
MHPDQHQRVEGSVQQWKPVWPAAIPAVNNPATRIEIFKNNVVPAPMAVLDQNFVSAGIKSRPDRGIYLIRQEPVHPVTVLNIFATFVCAVLKEAESGDTFNISFDVDLQISYFLSLPVFTSMPFFNL